MMVGDYKREAREAGAETDKLGEKVKKTGLKGKASLDELAHAAGLTGAALLAASTVAIVATAKFDKQMSEVAAVAGATSEEMTRLRDAAIEAGQATVFSAGQAAQAEAELAKAGISTADILSGALAGSLDLASAGSLDLATSAEIAANAMNTFGLQGSDVSHIADVLASAANKSAAGVEDLGQGLQQVGLVANQVGLSLEETVGLLAAFADRGLKGSDGATSLKTALARLAAPTDKAATTMKALGLSMYDASGNMVGAVEIAGQLQGALADLAPEQRNAALQTIFGSDAIRAANILYAEGAEGIQEYIDAVNDQGAAARMAGTKLDNLAGDVEQLTGSLETLFIKSGEGASGGLRTLTQAATGMVNAFSALPGPVQTTAVVVAGVGGAMLLAAAAGLKFRKNMGEALDELRKTGPVGTRAARGLELTTKWGLRAAAAFAAMQIASSALDAALNREADIDGLSDSLRHLGDSGEKTGELTRLFGKDLEGFAEDAELAGGGVNGIARAVEGAIPGLRQLNDALPGRSFGDAQERIQSVDDQLASMVRGGNIEQARGAFQRLLQASKLSLDELQALMPKYTNAMAEADKGASAQAAAAQRAKDANIALAGAFGEAASEADGLITAFDELNGRTLGWRESERKAEAAVDDLTDALKASGGSLDVHNEKGRAAAAAVDELAQAAVAAAQKKYDETGSVTEANKVYQEYVGQLRSVLSQSKLSKTEVDNLIAAIASMPTNKTVTINVRTVESETHSETARLYRRWGGITEHAQTGLLRDAAVYAATAPARYAFAEPATGGEAFVPRRGSYGRSMTILSAAAGWYGADVVPRGGGWYGSGAPAASGPGQLEVVVTPAAGSDSRVMAAIVQGLRFDVRTKTRDGQVGTYVNSKRGR